ncbi:MAG: hypothetical protein ORN51_03635, partial [Akkermansiaceae bacterium]|nr:hypothetical protein [Akkermansiaceae bacterium]
IGAMTEQFGAMVEQFAAMTEQFARMVEKMGQARAEMARCPLRLKKTQSGEDMRGRMCKISCDA